MSRLALVALATVSVVLLPETAKANFELGARTGFGVPFGNAAGDSDMNDAFVGQVPLWVDLGARITPNFSLSGFFSLGLGIPGDAFDDICELADASGLDCSQATLDLRFGIQAHYHFAPELERADPWIGAGLGYEVAGWGYTVEGRGQEVEVTIGAGGFEFLNLQGGVDFPLSKSVAIGPFAAVTLAQYGDVSTDCSGDCGGLIDGDEEIDDKALHSWVFVGARVVVLP